jgi:hypothetical protein
VLTTEQLQFLLLERRAQSRGLSPASFLGRKQLHALVKMNSGTVLLMLHRLDDDVPVCSMLLPNTYDAHNDENRIFFWKRGVLAPTRIRSSYLHHVLIVLPNVQILQNKNPRRYQIVHAYMWFHERSTC